MKRKPTGLIVATLGFILLAFPAWAQDSGPSGFSDARLTSLQPIDGGPSKACLNFEARYSKPLKERPIATLDVERSNMIDGVISFILKVTQLGNQRYNFAMETKDPRSCEELKKSKEAISVMVDGAVGPDGRSVLPDEETFRFR